MAFHVESEVGRLRQVLLHRPDLELQRLTPSNCADLLFDDVLWVKRARLAERLGADLLVLSTDVAAVELDWGTPNARVLREATVSELRKHHFAAGSMGPKIAAATAFVAKTGRTAAIGALSEAADVVRGIAGTRIVNQVSRRGRDR
jgi:hypothetical protein